MKIQDLKPAKGSKKRRKIVGRGPGSGHGKTSTRGHKGQMSRTGKGRTPGFEGGQMPLIRRVPKRGFNKRQRKGQSILNLKDIIPFAEDKIITPELLKEKGSIKGSVNFLKILGDGEVTFPLNIKAHAFSTSAIKKIENAGGKWEMIKGTK